MADGIRDGGFLFLSLALLRNYMNYGALGKPASLLACERFISYCRLSMAVKRMERRIQQRVSK